MCDHAQQDLRTPAADGYYKRPTLLEELQKQHDHAAEHAAEQRERSIKAINFLKANPAFDEFITLIRTGCISI